MSTMDDVRKLVNMHVDMHEPVPSGMSEVDKLTALARWWKSWMPEARVSIIIEKCHNMTSVSDGILGALLIGLEEVDTVKLAEERRSAKASHEQQ